MGFGTERMETIVRIKTNSTANHTCTKTILIFLLVMNKIVKNIVISLNKLFMKKKNLERRLAKWKPNCYCKEGEKFCGECEECGKPGHTQHCPLPIPYTGSWCNKCAKKIIRLDNEGLTPKEIFLILKRKAKKKS